MDNNDIDLDWSIDNEELIHSLTQTNEPQASLNAASTSNSSRGWSLEDDDAIINSICSNPALLKRLKNMLDSVESSVSPESTNNASEISNAISSTLRHPSDRQKDQSKAATCGLIEQPDSVSHGMMLFELGQEASY